MKFAVIIPAFNAAETLPATLDSLLAQTYANWQAVIVDDGSTDATASIAHRYCDIDHRFSIVRQSNGGLSAARNTGMAAAKYEYLLFLDADDWIAPTYLERFNTEFEDDPGLDALVCGWQFMLEDGSAADTRFPPAAEDMFPFFSHTCPFVVHSCVIHRRVIESAGVFDSAVGFVEDWDFWQRVSRTGARFKLIREVLAYYRMRKGSLSRKVYQSYNDARQMIFRGYGTDNRVKYQIEKYRYGMPDDKMNEHLCWLYCWYAGLCIGVGELVSGLTEPDMSGFNPNPKDLAVFIFEGVYRGGCFLPGDWGTFYDQHSKEVNDLFDLLEERSANTSSIRDSKLELFSMIADRLKGQEKQLVGGVLYLPIDVNKPVNDVRSGAELVILSAWMDGRELGRVRLLPENGILSEQKQKEAISENWSWPVMTRYLRYRNPGVDDAELDGPKGWELFLRELWGLPWTEADFYDESHEDNGLYETKEWKEKVRVDVERELFAIMNGQKPVEIEYFIGGSKGGTVVVQGEGAVIGAQAIRAAISAHGKFDLCKIAVTQGLIGKDSDIILREELRKSNGSEILG